jgi:hypothetical protein
MQIIDYWVKKNKFPSNQVEHIHWEALGKAMSESKLARRTFITKHATGMCGVGKFMKRWGERDTDACPRCGEPEDASHVWKCSQAQAQDVWDTSLGKLDTWMSEVGTLPAVKQSILDHLHSWKNPAGHHISNNTTSCQYDLQGECGWQSLLEGFIHKDWSIEQHTFYSTIQSPRNGKRWTIELIKKLWTVTWDQWEHRNATLHDQDNLVRQEEAKILDLRIEQTYQEYQMVLPPTDDHFFASPLSDLLKRSPRVKTAWLQQITAAKGRAVRKHLQRSMGNSNRVYRRQTLRQRKLSLFAMRQRMRQWLHLAR